MNPLRIFVIVEDPAGLSTEELSLLDKICADARYELCGLFVATEREHRAPLLPGALMRAEEALFLRSRGAATPHFEKRRGTITAERLGADAAYRAAAGGDVIIDMADAHGAPLLASAARFGVWRLTSTAADFGFREAATDVSATEVELVRFSAKSPGGETIARAAFNTKFVAAYNAAFAREKSIGLIERELARLHLSGEAPRGVARAPRTASPTSPDVVVYGFRAAGSLSRRLAFAAAARLRLRPGMFMLMTAAGSPFDFDPRKGKRIVPEGDHYWADPFIFRWRNKTYVFFEDYDYRTGRGEIGVAEIENGEFRVIGPALRRDYHLSFPFVFEEGGDVFMIPETGEARRVELWRATAFPTEWELYSTALEGVDCADTVIARHRGQWWLFTNISKGRFRDHCGELHVFRIDGPDLSNPVPHPLNPVVVDSRTARGGGRVFEKDGGLFRMSQVNERGEYGYGVNIMEITRIDMLDYREELARRIEPTFDSALMGCHHLDFVDDLVVMDIRKKWGGFPY
ncbi:MAG: glucosamine inositolphosphorylceramide transferase family protein [Pseudomonadota bacterium]